MVSAAENVKAMERRDVKVELLSKLNSNGQILL